MSDERRPSTSDALKNAHSIPAAIAGLAEVRMSGRGQPQPAPDNPGGYLPYGLSPQPSTPDRRPPPQPQATTHQSQFQDVRDGTSQSVPPSKPPRAPPRPSPSASASSSTTATRSLPPPSSSAQSPPQASSSTTVQPAKTPDRTGESSPGFLDITELADTLKQPVYRDEFRKFLHGLDAKGGCDH